MKVILLETIKNLGALGEIVNVKPGYGRNFLVPKNKAKFATLTNIEEFELKRADLEKEAARIFAVAQERATTFKDLTVVIPAMASDEGKLFGSIGINEIKDALSKQAIDVNKREIILKDALIHSLGDYVIDIQVHPEILVSINIQVISAK